jgi:uncharacterized protein YdeI (YjbR/CyaY-like superfamily)
MHECGGQHTNFKRNQRLKGFDYRYVSMEDALCFTNREEWRSWLSKNHDKKELAWLIFFKKNSKQKGITLDQAVEEAISFGWIDGKLRKLDEDRFILRFSPRRDRSVW